MAKATSECLPDLMDDVQAAEFTKQSKWTKTARTALKKDEQGAQKIYMIMNTESTKSRESAGVVIRVAAAL